MAGNALNKFVAILIIVIVLLIFIYFVAKPIVIIKYGETVVVENRVVGSIRKIDKPGLHLLVPFMEVTYKYNIRIQTYTMAGLYDEGDTKGDDALEVLTSDGQPAWLDISVMFKYNPATLIELHKNYTEKDYVDKILRPILRSTIRNIISKYSSVEVYSSNPEDIAKTLGKSLEEIDPNKIGRIAIQTEMFEQLKKEFELKFIIIDDFKIRNVKFSEEYQKAIEEKQIAQQQVEKAERDKQKLIIDSEAYKESVLIKAQADSEAVSLVGEMLKKYPNYVAYIYVQKLAENIKAIITNESTIMNFGSFLTE